MGFTVTRNAEGGNVILALKGTIDEDANFATLVLESKGAIIDLSAITAINSVGIREWIKWTKTFPSGFKLTVRNCPKIIVDQINMVQGFLPPGTSIESFFVPYYSEASGTEKMVLFLNGREFKDGKVFPPKSVKDDGGEEMEMDVIETKYFKFVTNG